MCPVHVATLKYCWQNQRTQSDALRSGQRKDSNLQPVDFSRSVIVLHRLAFSCVISDGVVRYLGGFGLNLDSDCAAGSATPRKRHSLLLPYRFELIREMAA